MDKLITLLKDEHISDIRIVSHDCIYVKRDGEKENISVLFDSKEEYLQCNQRKIYCKIYHFR